MCRLQIIADAHKAGFLWSSVMMFICLSSVKIPIPAHMLSCQCVVSCSHAVVFQQSTCCFCLSPLLFPVSCFLLDVFGHLVPSGCTLSVFLLLPLFSSSHVRLSPASSSSPSTLLILPPPRLPVSPWWLRVNSWRCCSTASVCPACRANPTPHQALGPSTPTKYFYLFIHPRPSGASWR